MPRRFEHAVSVLHPAPWRAAALRSAAAPCAAALMVLATAVVVRALGFRQVSDDDYARVVIAETFARTPRFDASGTSWLPFPFWVNGGAMMIFGRSLATAWALAPVLAAFGAAAYTATLQRLGASAAVALGSVALGLLVPWNAWLTAAPVPEALTGLLVAAACLGATHRPARPWLALGLLAATLSRYEAWPVALGFGVYVGATGLRAKGRERAVALGASLVAIAGPLVWLGWNAVAHGKATHFVDRVARYRAAMGLAPAALSDRLLGYPRALIDHGAAVLVLGLFGGLVLSRASTADRRRVLVAATFCGLQLAFLVYGDLRDGAPTHHPERALLAIFWVLAAWAVEGAAAFVDRRSPALRAASAVLFLAVALAGASGLRTPPGATEAENRDLAIARGLALRAENRAAFVVVPCAYEHFALVAAFGAPERVTIEGASPNAKTCPDVR